MERQLNLVREFHCKIGETVTYSPTLLQHDAKVDGDVARSLRQIVESFNHSDISRTQLTRRTLMAIEELAEWIEAHIAGNIVEAADAIGDRLYVLLGDAVATGLPVERVFEEVHCSNMTKFCSDNVTGKGKKLQGYLRPNLEAIVDKRSE